MTGHRCCVSHWPVGLHNNDALDVLSTLNRQDLPQVQERAYDGSSRRRVKPRFRRFAGDGDAKVLEVVLIDATRVRHVQGCTVSGPYQRGLQRFLEGHSTVDIGSASHGFTVVEPEARAAMRARCSRLGLSAVSPFAAE